MDSVQYYACTPTRNSRRRCSLLPVSLTLLSAVLCYWVLVISPIGWRNFDVLKTKLSNGINSRAKNGVHTTVAPLPGDVEQTLSQLNQMKLKPHIQITQRSKDDQAHMSAGPSDVDQEERSSDHNSNSEPNARRWMSTMMSFRIATAVAMTAGLLLALLPPQGSEQGIANVPKRRGRPPKKQPADPETNMQALDGDQVLGTALVLVSTYIQSREAERAAAAAAGIVNIETVLSDGKQERRKAAKDDNFSMVLMVRACTKDLGEAYLSFEQAVDAGKAMPSSSLEHLMFRLTGGDDWAEVVRRHNKPGQSDLHDIKVEEFACESSTPVPHSALECVQRIYNYLQGAGNRTNLAAVMLARAKAQAGDVWGAEAVALQENSQSAKMFLRHFTVALTAWASRRECWNAKRVIELMYKRHLPVSQDEYALLLESAIGSAPYSFVNDALMRMQEEYEGDLKENVIESAKAYFEAQGCECKNVTVEGDGAFGFDVLRLMKVPAEQVNLLQEEVCKVARGDRLDLTSYKDWLLANGPFDVVIDGANTALFGQNYEGGSFQFGQIRKIFTAAQESMGFKRCLVVLHRKRVESAKTMDFAIQSFIKHLRAQGLLYVVDSGYDDYYWTFAALYNNCPCITNDILCDLLFKLKDFPFFERWSRQNRIQYEFSAKGWPYLHPPLEYTVCVQQFNGLWMLPVKDEAKSWLQIRVDPHVLAEDLTRTLFNPHLPPRTAPHPLLAIIHNAGRLDMAVTNAQATSVESLPSLSTQSRTFLRYITNAAEERGVRQIVFGLPVDSSGTEHQEAKRIRELAERLHDILPHMLIKFQEVRSTASGQPNAIGVLRAYLWPSTRDTHTLK